MLNFCDFIRVYVFTTNHHLKDRFPLTTRQTRLNLIAESGTGLVGSGSAVGTV